MSNLYKDDALLWRETQIQLLQEGREREVDYNSLLQMLLEMGISDERTIEGLGRILILHLLKLMYQPHMTTRSWFNSVRVHRRDLKSAMGSKSKTLYNYFVHNLPKIYESARDMAFIETHLPDKMLPVECPFSVEEILDDDFFSGRIYQSETQ